MLLIMIIFSLYFYFIAHAILFFETTTVYSIKQPQKSKGQANNPLFVTPYIDSNTKDGTKKSSKIGICFILHW